MMILHSLRKQLNEPETLLRLAGAHNALSAKLAESAGFDGVWASSLEISAAAGVADDEQITARMLPAVEDMSRVVDCPILVDCASGPPPAEMENFVSVFEAAGAAGLCFEDARTPKVNSLRTGQQRLVPSGDFCSKITSAARARTNPDTCIVARVESLIAGTGQNDALVRANAYAAAGADAILIHSKSPLPEEVLSFVSAWHRDEPLVIVPSTYYGLTLDDVRLGGKVKMVIYANQGLRAAVAAMRQAFDCILRDGTTARLEGSLATLSELFALQDECVQQRTDRAVLPSSLDAVG